MGATSLWKELRRCWLIELAEALVRCRTGGCSGEDFLLKSCV